jgi:hypothetical protein
MKEVSTNIKSKFDTQIPYNNDFKCFQCLEISHTTSQYPNKRAIILHDHRKIVPKMTVMIRRSHHLRMLMMII